MERSTKLAVFACQNQVDTPKKKTLIIFSFLEITIPELQEGYKNGQWTIRDVIAAYSAQIEAIDHNGPKLQSVIVVNPEALAIADSPRPNSPRKQGTLHGVPVLLKDNIDTQDQMATTAGSSLWLVQCPYKTVRWPLNYALLVP